jgi:hypothetical protein
MHYQQIQPSAANPVAAPPSSEQLAFNTRMVEAAALVTVAATAAFLFVFCFRAGLKDPPLAVLSILLNCLLPIWLTTMAACVFTAFGTTRRTLLSGALTLALLFPILGLMLGTKTSLIAALCLAAIAILCRAHLGSLGWRGAARTLLQGALLAILLIVSGAAARLLLPEAMTLGLAHTDSYFHMAIAQMIAHHLVPSIGADGLSYERYHFASHAIAAGLSKATGASVALVYTYWGALSLKVQLLWAVFVCGLLLSAGPPKDLGVRIFPRVLYSMLVLIASGAVESESFLLGLSLYLGLFALLCSLIDERNEPRSFHVGFVFALVTAFVCAAAKVSVGFYCAAALAWIAWRHRRSFATLCLAAVALGALAIVTVLFLSPSDLTVSREAMVHILLQYGVYFIKWTTLLSYALPIVLIAIALMQPQFSRTGLADRSGSRLSVALEPLRPKLRPWSAGWRSLLALDAPLQLLALSLAACLLVLITIPIGTNMGYFSLVLLVTAGAVLPATLSQVSAIEISNPPVSAWLLAVVFATGLACAQGFAMDGSFALTAVFKSAWAAPADAAAKQPTIGIGERQIAASIRSTGTVFGLLQQRIPILPWTALMQDIQDKNSVAGGLVVHVLPTADGVWRRLVGDPGWWCMAGHLMIPAETGIVEIRSIEPKAIEDECASGAAWYGFGKDQDLHRTGDLSIGQLCQAAAQVPARRIYMLSSVTSPSANEVVDCASR